MPGKCAALYLILNHLLERHTGENIVTWVEEKLTEFNVLTENMVAFVHDNGSNIDLAGRLLCDKYGWYTEACAGHTLQLCVKAGLRIRPVEIVIAASHHLVKRFHKSELATAALRRRQEQMQAEQHSLVQDVPTRWNSTYFMIERLLEQHWPVTAVLSDQSVTKPSDRSLDLMTEQWNLLSELRPVLHLLQVATTYLSDEYNVSVSAVLPILLGLIKSMEVTEESLPLSLPPFPSLSLPPFLSPSFLPPSLPLSLLSPSNPLSSLSSRTR